MTGTPSAGRIALVTGASRGIGCAIAPTFANAGAAIAVNFFSNEHAANEASARIRGIGRRIVPVQGGLSVRQCGANGAEITWELNKRKD